MCCSTSFTLAGTASDVIAWLEAYAAAGVRLPILQPIAATTPEVRRIIEAGREFGRCTSAVAGATPPPGANRTAIAGT
jgi:hypothetical protein